MAKDTDTKIDEVEEVDYTEEGSTDAPDNGAPELSTAQVDAQRMLIGVVSDPEVAQILAARRDGRTVKIVDVDTPDPEPEQKPTSLEIPSDTLDELDPGIKTVVESIAKHIDSRLTPLTEQVNKLQGLADLMQQRTMDTQIGEISGKHKDFEKYRTEMARLSRAEGSGLAVEQLYVLAKLKDGGLNLTEPSTHSEKPTPTPRSRGAGQKKVDASSHGRKAWNTLLADTLDRTLSPHE